MAEGVGPGARHGDARPGLVEPPDQPAGEGALAEGFDFVAMARALLRQPDLPNRMRDGEQSASLCVHCNKCMPTIFTGTRCVLTTPEVHA